MSAHVDLELRRVRDVVKRYVAMSRAKGAPGDLFARLERDVFDPPECSICRGRHGLERIHPCE